jgi:hypothetical protein
MKGHPSHLHRGRRDLTVSPDGKKMSPKGKTWRPTAADNCRMTATPDATPPPPSPEKQPKKHDPVFVWLAVVLTALVVIGGIGGGIAAALSHKPNISQAASSQPQSPPDANVVQFSMSYETSITNFQALSSHDKAQVLTDGLRQEGLPITHCTVQTLSRNIKIEYQKELYNGESGGSSVSVLDMAAIIASDRDQGFGVCGMKQQSQPTTSSSPAPSDNPLGVNGQTTDPAPTPSTSPVPATPSTPTDKQPGYNPTTGQVTPNACNWDDLGSGTGYWDCPPGLAVGTGPSA